MTTQYEAEVLGISNEDVTSVTIPKEVKYNYHKYQITAIGRESMQLKFNFGNISSIKFEEPLNIKRINSGAFYSLNVVSLDLSACTNLTSIGEGAFRSCGLESIKLPSSVKEIGACAFEGCPNLKSFTLPIDVSAISDSTFWYCAALESIVVPIGSNLKSIGYRAFKGASKLKSFDFSNCQKLEVIGAEAFYDCQQSQFSNQLSCHLRSIGSKAFFDCHFVDNTFNLTTTDTISINHGTFERSNIKTARINAKSINITEGNFMGFWRELESCELTAQDDITINQGTTENVKHLYLSADRVNINSLVYTPALQDLTIIANQSLTFGNTSRMWNSDNFTTLNITSKSTSSLQFDQYTFGNAANLQHLNLTLYAPPAFSAYAFDVPKGCNGTLVLESHGWRLNDNTLAQWLRNTGISKVTLKGEVDCPTAFRNCSNIESLIIDNDVSKLYLDGSAFVGCNNLRHITVNCCGYTSSNNQVYRKSNLGYELAAVSPYLGAGRLEILKNILGYTVTGIGNNALYEYGGTVHVPYSVISIGKLDNPRVIEWMFDSEISPAVNSYTSFENSILLVPSLAEYNKAPFNRASKIYSLSNSSSNNDEDVNNDGKVNATDAMQIYNYILSH